MFDISLSGKAPIYEQLVSGITGLISSGRLAEGERLPAVREVAKQLGINPNTVQKSYFLLEQAGLIYSIPAKGSYVCEGKKTAQALKEQSLEKLGAEIAAAKKAGITEAEISALLSSIYSCEKGENHD